MNPYVEDIAEALRAAPLVSPGGTQDSITGERPCPVCKRLMVVERNQGVAVDVCREHGVWFDLGELPTLLARARAGSRVGLATELADAKKSGRISGILFGLWSLMFD
jgi:Zn-finger nucleic acid-binding protein